MEILLLELAFNVIRLVLFVLDLTMINAQHAKILITYIKQLAT